MKILKEEDEAVEVQMAPLIDCVFLLLVFFLVATTLKKIEPVLPLELPVSHAALRTPVQQELLVIGVDQRGQVYLRGQPASTTQLRDALRELARQPNPRVRLDVDRRVPFEEVVRVVDTCVFEGIKDVGFLTRDDRRY